MLLNPNDVPDAAVQIAADALRNLGGHNLAAFSSDVVAALAAAGWLTPPDRRAALEAVAAAANDHGRNGGVPYGGALDNALDALDAAAEVAR